MTLLILDLDETLIYATRQWKDPDFAFTAGPYAVYMRPYVEQFLNNMAEQYEIAVWTRAGDDYTEEVINNLPFAKDPAFVWTRQRCTRVFDREKHKEIYIKDFKKVKRAGYDIKRVLIVDDSRAAAARNYGNLVLVKRYEGEPDDNELLLLEKYLKKIVGVKNVRSIDKRSWRSEIGS